MLTVEAAVDELLQLHHALLHQRRGRRHEARIARSGAADPVLANATQMLRNAARVQAGQRTAARPTGLKRPVWGCTRMAAAQHSGMTDQRPSGSDDDISQPHDFAVQKQLHQQIRNDPDYDDWEYGTEPLPQEAWVQAKGSEPAAGGPSR
jgi:hypothetical protein